MPGLRRARKTRMIMALPSGTVRRAAFRSGQALTVSHTAIVQRALIAISRDRATPLPAAFAIPPFPGWRGGVILSSRLTARCRRRENADGGMSALLMYRSAYALLRC